MTGLVDPAVVRRVLVLRPGALGDTLVAVPALRVLRRAFPGAALSLAGHAAAGRLLVETGEVDESMAFDDLRLGWLLGRGHPPAALPDLVIAWLGDSGRLEANLAALRVPLLQAPARSAEGSATHNARHLLDSLRELGLAVLGADETPLRVAVAPSDDILVHPGSGAPGKNWSAGQFAAAIGLLEDAGARVRLIVGEADDAAADALRQLRPSLVRVERRSLPELAALLAGCRAYLGNDSGVSHLAGLCGARTVAMFGPTSPEAWKPIGSRVTTLPFEAEPAAVVAALLS